LGREGLVSCGKYKCTGMLVYARSERDMRAEAGLYALRTCYARWSKFMRAQNELCAVISIYPRSEQVMPGEVNISAFR